MLKSNRWIINKWNKNRSADIIKAHLVIFVILFLDLKPNIIISDLKSNKYFNVTICNISFDVYWKLNITKTDLTKKIQNPFYNFNCYYTCIVLHSVIIYILQLFFIITGFYCIMPNTEKVLKVSNSNSYAQTL